MPFPNLTIDELLAEGERFGLPPPPKDRWFVHIPGRTGRPPRSREWKTWVAAIVAARSDAARKLAVERGDATTLSWAEIERHRAALAVVRRAEAGSVPILSGDSVRALWRRLARLYPGYRCQVCSKPEAPWKWADPALARALHASRLCWDCRERAAWVAAGVVDGIIGGVRVIA